MKGNKDNSDSAQYPSYHITSITANPKQQLSFSTLREISIHRVAYRSQKIQSLTSVLSHTYLFSPSSSLCLYNCNSNLYIGLRLYIQGPLLTNFLADLTTNDLYPQNVVNQYTNMHKIFKSGLFSARRTIFCLHGVTWTCTASVVLCNSLTQNPFQHSQKLRNAYHYRRKEIEKHFAI